jgi:hypothetical protein
MKVQEYSSDESKRASIDLLSLDFTIPGYDIELRVCCLSCCTV